MSHQQQPDQVSRRQALARTGAVMGGLAAGAIVIQGSAQAEPVRASASRLAQRPRTQFSRAVDQLVTKSSPQFLVDHCRRSYELAVLLARAQDNPVDEEVLFAGVMLHDLGLTSRFHSSSVRFEVASANAARDFARNHGLSGRRADAVWDVAALHATGGFSDFKSTETALGSAGIVGDVTGLGLDQLDQAKVKAIMATRPGFAHPFIDAIIADLQDKPEVADGTWMESIALDHIPGFRPGSVEAAALADPFENR
jgi:HD domain